LLLSVPARAGADPQATPITTITVSNTVAVPSVRRFGMQMSDHLYYDRVVLKNLAWHNAGFEALQYQTVVRCASGTATGCLDDNPFTQWPTGYIANGGDVERVASDASPPFAAQFSTPALDGGSPFPFAFMNHVFAPLVTTSAHFAVAMRVDKYPSAPSSYFTSTSISLDGQSSIAIILKATSAAIQQTVVTEAGTTYPILDVNGTIPLGKWVNIEMDFNVSSSPITLEVHFDGVQVLAPLSANVKAVSPTITLGETYVDNVSDGVVFVNDNVVFDFN